MVGGPPSHSAIKERWGPGLVVRGSPRRQTPHRHPNPNPILRRGAASDGKHHRRRQRHPDAYAAAKDVTAPTPLSTERRCRRADGISERDPDRRFHHSDCFDHYGLRWSATSHSPSLCLSVDRVLGSLITGILTRLSPTKFNSRQSNACLINRSAEQEGGGQSRKSSNDDPPGPGRCVCTGCAPNVRQPAADSANHKFTTELRRRCRRPCKGRLNH